MSVSKPSIFEFNGYTGADLMRSFLACLSDSSRHSLSSFGFSIKAMQAQYLFNEAQPVFFRAPFYSLDLTTCLDTLNNDHLSLSLRSDVCLRLWETLRKILTEIEPLARKHSCKLLPSSLDEAWALLEALEIERETDTEKRGKSGSSTRRL